MSNDTPQNDRRAKVAAMNARNKAKERRRNALTAVAIGLPAIILVVVTALVLVSSRPASVDQVLPPSVSEEGGPFRVSASAAQDAPVLDLFEDFQCPACQSFESAIGPTIEQVAEDGSAQVQIHMMSFLDANLGGDASSRAIQAAAAADEQGRFLAYHAEVYANQGAEGTGFSSEQLEQFAVDAGVPDIEAWRESYESGKYEQYVRDAQAFADDAGVTSTPTVRLDGDDIRDQLATPQSLVDLIAAAGGTSTPVVPGDEETYDGDVTDEGSNP